MEWKPQNHPASGKADVVVVFDVVVVVNIVNVAVVVICVPVVVYKKMVYHGCNDVLDSRRGPARGS